MKKFLLGTVALVAVGATVPALAADLAARPYTKAPPYVAQPIYNWTGFYIGGHLGGAFGGDNSLTGSDGRFLGGLQGGADYQFAPSWVVGIEAQYSWLGNSNNGVLFPGGVLVTSNSDQLGSVTGRLGCTWGPALLYAKGGYAWKDGNNLNVSVAGLPVASTAIIATATPWAPASNTCSRRAGPPRSNTSTTTSATRHSRSGLPRSWASDSVTTSTRLRPG